MVANSNLELILTKWSPYYIVLALVLDWGITMGINCIFTSKMYVMFVKAIKHRRTPVVHYHGINMRLLPVFIHISNSKN